MSYDGGSAVAIVLGLRDVGPLIGDMSASGTGTGGWVGGTRTGVSPVCELVDDCVDDSPWELSLIGRRALVNWKGAVSVLLETSGLLLGFSDRTRSHSAGGYAPRGVHGAISSALFSSSFLFSSCRLRRRRKRRKAIKRRKRHAAPMPAAIPAIFPVLLLGGVTVELGVFETEGPSTAVWSGLSVHEALGAGIELRPPVPVVGPVDEPLLCEEVWVEREAVESLLEVGRLLVLVAAAGEEVGKVSCRSI